MIELPDSREGKSNAEILDLLLAAVKELQNAVDDSTIKRLEEALNDEPVHEPLPRGRDWKPVNDGKMYWTDPHGWTTPIDQVPKEVLERWGRGKAEEAA